MNNQSAKTIFITGGHITPAIALIDEIRQEYPQWHIICVGRSVALEGSGAQSVERRLVTARGAVFLPLAAGRLSRSINLSSLASFLKIPVGYIQALWYCVRHKPDIIVSFGGYVALPVGLAATTLRIPVITHEQTRSVGLANRIIGSIARTICITFEDQLHNFPKGKTVVTGLPMRKELFHPPQNALFTVASSFPAVYITGGSTGAVSLNDVLFPAIDQLTKTYTVFHQTGKLSLQKAMHIRDQLPQSQRDRYIVQDFFDTEAVSWILHQASLVIGRSGANTVMEAAALGKTMICIPLPWSAAGEQIANAKWLEQRGLAVVVPQQEARADNFVSVIDAALEKRNKQKRTGASSDIPQDGARRLLLEVNAILGT